jgi:lycopene beta-cyclase
MTYDYAILGGGAAGLSLALALVRSPLKAGSILIVEKDAKNTNDRTWCFWSDVPTPLDRIAYHTWPNLRFCSPGVERSFALAPFRYQMVRGLDFYRAAHAELEQHNVTFVQASAEVQDGQDCAIVQAGGREFSAAWAFDSRIRPEDMLPDPRFNSLKQHFTGWEVETVAPVFDPQTATLFDLRTPQRGGVTFFYILPFSPQHALVEYTLFSPDLLPAQEYDLALQAYLRDELKLEDYRILETEHGVIPMTDRPFPRRLGQRVMAIGSRGGRVKPSTGYAFARIQRDSARIVDSLVRCSHPFAVPPDPLRQRFYERLSLDVMAHSPEGGRAVFSGIFRRNPIQPVLRFLDDRSSFLDDLRVITACPPRPFLGAGFRLAGKFLRSQLSLT